MTREIPPPPTVGRANLTITLIRCITGTGVSNQYGVGVSIHVFPPFRTEQNVYLIYHRNYIYIATDDIENRLVTRG